MKLPEGAKVASNGVNQQILQTSAISSGKGGGPANGSPFYSISGMLGLNDNGNSKNSLDPAWEQQMMIQQAQISELKKELRRSKSAQMTPEEEVIWTQLPDGETVVGPVLFEQEIGEEHVYVMPQEQIGPRTLEGVPMTPAKPMMKSRKKAPTFSLSSFSPTSLLAPSNDAQIAAAQMQMRQKQQMASSEPNILTKASSALSATLSRPKIGMTQKPQPRPRFVAGSIPRPQPDESHVVLLETPTPIRQVSRTNDAIFSSEFPTTISTDSLWEELETEEEGEEIEELPPLLSDRQLLQEEVQTNRQAATTPRQAAPTPNMVNKANVQNRPCVPRVPKLDTYGKR